MSQAQQRHHILCINNSKEVLELFRELLEEEGYRVTTQSYVDKDLDAISALKPDLIVLDYMWDHEDSGWALLQMIKMSPQTENIPIVLCTGAVRQVNELEAHLLDMQVVVVFKPFKLDHLVQTIRSRLNVAPES
ncbi:MAG TPA: response regulator [Thermomicrobiales bacterium]|nr:response regulator [Thermomicrobiales bacterium]